uniref:Vesicular, overexpressed in cancer, prosurvival protein 1 n=1 Tax=Ciona savignyi TaxID=51511 RepID=H2YE78_CIOSA
MGFEFSYFLLFLSFHGCFQLIQAREVCTTDHDTTLICPDSYSSIGFCCNYQGNGRYNNCCSYTAVWGLWYFWFCIVTFVFIVGGVVALCKFCSKKGSNSSRGSVAHSDIASPTVVAYNPATAVSTVKVSDFPPSYDQLQQQ